MVKYLLSVCSAIVLVVYGNFAYYRDSILHIYFLDIGQGDSVLIETPDHYLVLVDGGPDSAVLSELGNLLPFFIRRIDLVIISHAHSDHIDGVIDLASRYQLGNVITNSSTSALSSKLGKIATEKGFQINQISSNDDFKVGCCLNFDIVWPLQSTKESDENDNSVAFVMTYNDFAFYSGGDLGKDYEEKALLGMDVDLDLYKAGHHGSRTSTSQKVMAKFKPELFVISDGVENKFGHPHKEVLDILEAEQINYLRTDLQGTVNVSSDGKNFWYSTENNQ